MLVTLGEMPLVNSNGDAIIDVLLVQNHKQFTDRHSQTDEVNE